MKAPRKRKCRICKRIFQPRPLAWRQRVCSRKACQRARRRKNWQDWFQRNRDYFQSKYGEVWGQELRLSRIKWQKANPDYMRGWREKNKEHLREYMREYMRKRRRRLRQEGNQ